MKFTKKSAKVFGAERPDVQITAMVREPGTDSEAFIPRAEENYTFDRDRLSVVLTFLQSSWAEGAIEGLQLIGPTGSGKTSLIEQVCNRLDVPVVSFTAHDRLEVPELIFTREAVNGSTLTIDGPLTDAMRNGYVFVLNEIDLLEPGTATGLNDILERGFVVIPSTNELVRAAPGFAFVATSNTGGGGDEAGMYVGTRVQNMAFRDRFIKLYVDYLSEEAEISLLANRFKDLSPALLKGFVDVAKMIREAFMAGTGLDVTMSTRTLIRWVRLSGQYHGMQSRGISPVHYALDLALANGTSDAVQTSLHGMVQQVMGVEHHVSTAAVA